MAFDKKEYMKQYRKKNKERIAEQHKEWYQENKEHLAEWRKEYRKQYYQENKEKILEKNKEYRNTPMGRAAHLVDSYNRLDKKYGRGKGNLTPKYVYDNILFEECVYCGAKGWQIIGCNRIDNSKPHTKDNVEPCCMLCNCKQHGKETAKQVYQYTLDGELVAIYPSTLEAAKQTGFNQGLICACCNGKIKTHMGFMWSYVPL